MAPTFFERWVLCPLPFNLRGFIPAETNKEWWKCHSVTSKVIQLHLLLFDCLLWDTLSPQLPMLGEAQPTWRGPPWALWSTAPSELPLKANIKCQLYEKAIWDVQLSRAFKWLQPPFLPLCDHKATMPDTPDKNHPSEPRHTQTCQRQYYNIVLGH